MGSKPRPVSSTYISEGPKQRTIVGGIEATHVTTDKSVATIMKLGDRPVGETADRVGEVVVVGLAQDPLDVGLDENNASFLQEVPNDAVIALARVGTKVNDDILERTVLDASGVGASESIGREGNVGAVRGEVRQGVCTGFASTTEAILSKERRLGNTIKISV